MASPNPEDMSSSKKLNNVTLACGDEGVIPAHTTVLAPTKTQEDSFKDVKIEEFKFEKKKTEDILKIKVKYALNKVKNLEEAKANASRQINVDRMTTNDIKKIYESEMSM